MGGRSARYKGKRGELEVASALQALGLDVRRTPNSGGLDWKGDLQGIDGFHIEVKRQETIQFGTWWKQTLEDCPPEKRPLLVFRKNGMHWIACMKLEDVAMIIKLAIEQEKTGRDNGSHSNQEHDTHEGSV